MPVLNSVKALQRTHFNLSNICNAKSLASIMKYLYETEPRAFDLDEETVNKILEQVENGTYRNTPFRVLICDQNEDPDYYITYDISLVSKPGCRMVIIPANTDLLVYTAIALLLNKIVLKKTNIIIKNEEQFYSELLSTSNVKCLYRLNLVKNISTVDRSSLLNKLLSMIGKNIIYDYIESILNNRYIDCNDNEAYLSGISIPPIGYLSDILLNIMVSELDNEFIALYPSINYCRHVSEVYISNYGDITEDDIYSLLDKLGLCGDLYSIRPGNKTKCLIGDIGISNSGNIYIDRI